MRLWWRRARRPDLRTEIEAALRESLARYADVRAATASCLYATQKLAGEAARQRAIAEMSRAAAREALEANDTRRSRAMVAAARTALDLAREAQAGHEELRASADAALEELRRIARIIAELERDRLRALAVPRSGCAAPASLEETRRALEVLDAERTLDAELARGSS